MSAESERWQLTGASAEFYERHLVPTITRPWALHLVDRAGVGPGDRVLDVACGTGVVARAAAARAGDDGRVAAVDVNPGMLEVARSLPGAVSIEWYEGSALALPFERGEFSVVLCQLGLQFFSDPATALREMARVLSANGRAAVSVFASIERNPAPLALSDAIDRHFGPRASHAKRDEHSLADIEQLRRLFDDGGFTHVRMETATRDVHFASVAEYVRSQFVATPLAALLADRDLATRERLTALVSADVTASLADHVTSNGFTFPQELHVALATARGDGGGDAVQ